MIRITITRPTIDKAQVNPASAERPIAVKIVWKPTISQATTHSSGASTVSNIEFIESSVVAQVECSPAWHRDQRARRSVTIVVKSGGRGIRTYVRDPFAERGRPHRGPMGGSATDDGQRAGEPRGMANHSMAVRRIRNCKGMTGRIRTEPRCPCVDPESGTC